jgi:processive 1,2-diacylglycerol beta-glucosyltransferase
VIWPPDARPFHGRQQLTVRDTSSRAPRVLILTASIGEGHDLPARTLGVQLRSERPGLEVVTEDGLAPLGRLVTAISAEAPRFGFFHFQWLWDLGFWVFARFGPTRRATQALVSRAGRAGLLRLIRSVDPQVIVSTYPTTTEVLAHLRRSGALKLPVVSAITDIAGLYYWAAPGIDVHLITHPESVDEVRRIAGVDTSVVCVHGLTAAEFLGDRSAADARAALGLPAVGKLVLVSGGGWGVGDVEGGVEEALRIDEVSQVVCLTGRNDGLRRRLARRFDPDPRVRLEPFTEQMPDWLAAADVLVHSTGGLTVLEALLCGCPAISYGWGRGHIRLHNAAFHRFGLAEVALSRSELVVALRRALAGGRTRTDGFRALPSAASVVLAAVDPG